MTSDYQRPLLEDREELFVHSHGSINTFCESVGDEDEDKSRDLQAKKNSKRAFWVSMLVVLLYSLCMFPASYVLSLYLTYRWSEEANVTMTSASTSCIVNHSDPVQKAQDDIQARVSNAAMYLGYALSLPSVVSSVLIGAYSDVIGRRKTFIMPLAGVFMKCMIYIFVVKYHLNVLFLYVANAIEGMSGSFYVILLASYTITADIHESKSSRMFWMNVLNCFNQVVLSGFTVGMGVVVDRLGFLDVYVLCIVPIVISVLAVIFFLPETRPEKAGTDVNFFSNVGRVLGLYTSQGSRRHRLTLFLCLVMFCFAVINSFDINSLNALYLMLQPFCWNATLISIYAAANGAIGAIGGTIFISVAMQCGCVSNDALGMIGMLFQGGSFIMQSFSLNTWMMYMVAVLGSPAFPSTAIVRGIMSILVGPYNQGAMSASIAIVEVFSHLLSNTSTFQLYSATVDYMPGAVFLLMAGYSFLNVGLFAIYFYIRKPQPKKGSIEEVIGEE